MELSAALNTESMVKQKLKNPRALIYVHLCMQNLIDLLFSLFAYYQTYWRLNGK